MKHKKISAIIILITYLFLINCIPAYAEVTENKAGWSSHYGNDGTVCTELGINGYEYYKWLVNHDGTLSNDIDNETDNTKYYIGTRYVGYDHRNPLGDCKEAYGVRDVKGVAAMNCTGFVWHVLMKSAVNSGKTMEWAEKNIPTMGDSFNGRSTNYVYWVKSFLIKYPNTEHYVYGTDKYNSVISASDAAVKDRILEYGDIIFMGTTFDAHVGIYTGDGTTNEWWDSSGDHLGCNEWGDKIDLPLGSFKYLYVIKGGAKDNYADSLIPKDPSSDGLLGDLNDDRMITSGDSLLILRNSVGLSSFTELQKKLADVDRDGNVTSSDALDVLRYSVNLPTDSFCGQALQ